MNASAYFVATWLPSHSAHLKPAHLYLVKWHMCQVDVTRGNTLTLTHSHTVTQSHTKVQMMRIMCVFHGNNLQAQLMMMSQINTNTLSLTNTQIE